MSVRLPPVRAVVLALAAALALLPSGASGQADAEARHAQRETPLVKVVREFGPAVVNVYQDVVQDVELPFPYNRLWGPQRSRRTSLGSGFVIDPEGYILTNAHVIQGGNRGIRVKLSSGDVYDAQLVNIDTDNDVALLKITPRAGTQLVAARLGTSSDVMVGESVIAIGNPLGNENSVATGIVSSVYRDVRVPSPDTSDHLSPAFKDFIQIDAPINPGNSGGPLINVLGEVIGINFAVATEAQGIGFAIPVDRVRKSLVDNLLNPRLHREVVTGLEVEGDPELREVRVASVAPDGPAARAGLRQGDVLLRLHDEPVAWEFDVSKALLATRPGDEVPVVVRRDGQTLNFDLRLAHDESPMLTIWRKTGLSVVDHPRYKGVRVERVDPAGPGALLGLQQGDLVDGVGDRTVDTTLDLYQLLRELPAGTRATVHVWRGDAASVGQLRLN